MLVWHSLTYMLTVGLIDSCLVTVLHQVFWLFWQILPSSSCIDHRSSFSMQYAVLASFPWTVKTFSGHVLWVLWVLPSFHDFHCIGATIGRPLPVFLNLATHSVSGITLFLNQSSVCSLCTLVSCPGFPLNLGVWMFAWEKLCLMAAVNVIASWYHLVLLLWHLLHVFPKCCGTFCPFVSVSFILALASASSLKYPLCFSCSLRLMSLKTASALLMHSSSHRSSHCNVGQLFAIIWVLLTIVLSPSTSNCVLSIENDTSLLLSVCSLSVSFLIGVSPCCPYLWCQSWWRCCGWSRWIWWTWIYSFVLVRCVIIVHLLIFIFVILCVTLLIFWQVLMLKVLLRFYSWCWKSSQGFKVEGCCHCCLSSCCCGQSCWRCPCVKVDGVELLICGLRLLKLNFLLSSMFLSWSLSWVELLRLMLNS